MTNNVRIRNGRTSLTSTNRCSWATWTYTSATDLDGVADVLSCRVCNATPFASHCGLLAHACKIHDVRTPEGSILGDSNVCPIRHASDKRVRSLKKGYLSSCKSHTNDEAPAAECKVLEDLRSVEPSAKRGSLNIATAVHTLLLFFLPYRRVQKSSD